jgi:predicted acylesterase/phospholipase RssA
MLISRHPSIRCLIPVICLVVLSACSSVLRNPVPEDMYRQASVLGRQDLRIWGDQRQQEEHPAVDLASSESLEERFGGIMHREHNYLAISGGGADGAYGAGVLLGWTETGTRPEFTMVTGVSTGALTAPFAFLGSAYDAQLKELYTTLDTSSIFNRRSIFTIIRGDSVVDSAPLARMLRKYITREMVAEIGRQYRRGRSLTIGTTNLDAGRSVIWNIGRIAASGHPGAPELIGQVLLASASIPGVFPPVYISVQGPDGRTYEEMHVDGGTTTQMFLYPSSLDMAELLKVLDVKGTPTAYLIRNSRLQPDYAPVMARVTQIASRSVTSLIRTQGIGDVYRIAALAKRDGVNIELTWITDEALKDPGHEVFDPLYMAGLFDYGYHRALAGKVWTEIDIDKIFTRKE